jgi:hypothetical protein
MLGAYDRPLDRRLDGFGTRWFDPKGGRVEVLDLVPALSTPEAECAIRARMMRVADLTGTPLATARRLERLSTGLSVVTAVPIGVRLCDLLACFESGVTDLPQDALVELAGSIVHAVKAVHELPAAFSHGALSAAHVLISCDGRIVLLGAIFADALAALERSRAELWRDFGVAMAASAGPPRCDRRSDVTALGVLVLALLLRRALRPDEYPRHTSDVIEAAAAGDTSLGPALRGWLRRAVQLDERTAFATAVDAAKAFDEIGRDARTRRRAAAAARAAVEALTTTTHYSPPMHDARFQDQ